MTTKKVANQFIISTYKTVVYVLMMVIFWGVFSNEYEGLVNASRTSVVTMACFAIVLVLMGNVYGNFEIGEKKSKPVLFSTFVNVVAADILAFAALKVMAIHEFSTISSDIIMMCSVFLIQFFMIYVATYVGNFLYFSIYEPKNVLIFHSNFKRLNKVLAYLKAHSKQYKIVDVVNTVDVPVIDFTNVDMILLLGLSNDALQETCIQAFLTETSVMYNTGIYNSLGGSKSRTIIDDILLSEIKSHKMSYRQVMLKRILDLLVATIALILTSPIFLIIAILIKLDDRGPVFFMQDRVTQNGKVFKIIKFRTMKQNVDDKPATENDDRITPVGHNLRRFRVDELPQFLNIFKGDMSVVGPRPESVRINQEIIDEVPEFQFRLKVKAGLTGYAQIFGKYNTTPKSKLLLDLEYIENYSLISDIKLILQTFIVFVKKDSTEGFADDGTLMGLSEKSAN